MISKGENPLTDIKHRSAFSFAFPIMVPMGLSFFFLGLGFGLYATSSQGFPWWTAPVLASTIFRRFYGIRNYWLLMAGFDPLNAFCFDHVCQWTPLLLWFICITEICEYGMEMVPYRSLDV